MNLKQITCNMIKIDQYIATLVVNNLIYTPKNQLSFYM